MKIELVMERYMKDYEYSFWEGQEINEVLEKALRIIKIKYDLDENQVDVEFEGADMVRFIQRDTGSMLGFIQKIENKLNKLWVAFQSTGG